MTNDSQQAQVAFDPATGQPVAPLPAIPDQPAHKLLAPIWHTILIVIVLLANSYITARFTSSLSPSELSQVTEKARIVQYSFTIVIEFVLLGVVAFGLRLHKKKIRDLIGGKWPTPEAFFMDVLIAGGFWIVASLVLAGLGYALGLSKGANVEAARRLAQMLAPQSGLGLLIWVALSCVAGFVEEIIFRGYLQQQFAILTGNVYVGLIASALVFGGGHGYEGTRRMVLIAVFGAMFGILSHLTKSLRPAMMAHAWHDAISGFILRFISQKGFPPMH